MSRELEVDPERYPALAALIAKGKGDDGPAGVREPRRPKPSAPTQEKLAPIPTG